MSNLLPNKMTYGRQEQGAALIAVLLVLILILTVGVVALRKSTTDLRVASADQMDNALLQSSESANQKLESLVNGKSNDAFYFNLMNSRAGAFGYFLSSESSGYNRGDEFVFCHTDDNTYLRNKATIFRSGGRMGGTRGFCNTGDENYRYTTARGTIATQVSIGLPRETKSDDANDRAFKHRVTPNATYAKQRHNFDVYSTSVVPSYGNPDNCFSRSPTPVNKEDSRMLSCLQESNSPYKMVYQQAVVAEEVDISQRTS